MIKLSMEVRTEVKQYQIDGICPRCKTGRLRPFGNSEHGEFPHQCNNVACNAKVTVPGKVYPYLITELVPTSTTTE